MEHPRGKNEKEGGGDDEDVSLMSEAQRRALLTLACEHDRVDILQSLLSTPSPVPEVATASASATQPDKEDVMVEQLPPSPSATKKLNLALLNEAPESVVEAVEGVGADDGDGGDVDKGGHDGEVDDGEGEEYDDDDDYGEDDSSEEEYDSDEYYSDEEDSYYSDEGYEEDLEGEDEEGDVVLNYFVPPLHVAVASGSVNATTALLRMGADPSVTVVGRENIPLSGPMAKFRRSAIGGAYTMLSLDEDHSYSNDVLERLKHAFEAEALRAIGGDEDSRLKQLLGGGMPPDAMVGGRMLYEWAVELDALKCRMVLNPNDDGKPRKQQLPPPPPPTPPGEQKKVEDATTSTTRRTTTSSPDTPRSSTNRRKVLLAPVDDLRRQIEEQAKLESTLASCLDEFMEERSLYQAILYGGGNNKNRSNGNGGHDLISSPPSPDTKKNAAAGVVRKVRSLKAAKAQQETELDFYSQKYEEAREELDELLDEYPDMVHRLEEEWEAPLEEENVAEQQPQQQPAGEDGAEAAGGSSSDGNEKKKNDNARSKDSDDGEEEGDVAKLELILAASQTKVSKIRVKIADVAEENARDMAEVEYLGLGGAVRLVRSLKEEVRGVEEAVREAKIGAADCGEKINAILRFLDEEEGEEEEGEGEEMRNERELRVQRKVEQEPAASQQQEVSRSHSGAPLPSAGADSVVAMADPNSASEFGVEKKISFNPMEKEHVPTGARKQDEGASSADDLKKGEGEVTKSVISPRTVTDAPAPPPASTAAAASAANNAPTSRFRDGDEAMYTFEDLNGRKKTVAVTVVKVHYDDRLVPYYTIALPVNDSEGGTGKEKQTDDAHLEPLAVATDAAAVARAVDTYKGDRDGNGLKAPSDAIATGQSTALAVRTSSSRYGNMPSSLWDILWRMMGLGRDDGGRGYNSKNGGGDGGGDIARPRLRDNTRGGNVMIV